VIVSFDIDLAQLVGAASAPVALIIATSIYLGNLGGKYAALFNRTHAQLADYRDLAPDDSRRQLLKDQLHTRGQRLRTLIRASFWLGVAELFFIVTVFLTGLSVVLPASAAIKGVTAAAMLSGLLCLAFSVALEIGENHQSSVALMGDFAEFPEFDGFDHPRTSPDEVRELRVRAQHSHSAGSEANS
jgi:hypothetical protein